MEIRLRTTRTLKVTELQISAEAREHLARLYQSPEYEALLDVMERACISVETGLLNASIGLPEEILGAHAVAKAGWLFFTYTQQQVQNAYVSRDRGAGEPTKEPSLNDLIQGVEPYQLDPNQQEPNGAEMG